MTRIKWREVFKFLWYGVGRNGGQLLLVPLGISVPFLGYTISPELLGARAALQFVLFLVFLALTSIVERIEQRSRWQGQHFPWHVRSESISQRYI